MGLNRKAINEVFRRTSLCEGKLIRTSGMATEYCAMGALAKACGATDAELRMADGGGNSLYANYHRELLTQFGIESIDQFQEFMLTNDKARNNATRNTEVADKVTMMSIDQVTALFKDAELSAERSSVTQDGELEG